ncbi:NagC family transcriptional regulator [Angustibacter aerolatus]|uniref:NagC family transcriptional regulator n=1 Tax=Angustibacter aerolatus TaxID=1162965 RepID=A0ABQ6JML4_9ACTN|nr:NagC family transcriptional regulator [Angustibacter aerolatus]
MTVTTRPPAGATSRTLRPTAKVLPEHARRHNRSLVLQSLLQQGPASRADLARETGLTRVTVSDLVADLMGEELVEEPGVRPGSRVGKPATLVGLRADGALIVSLDLSDEQRLAGALLDLTGQVVLRRTSTLRGRTGESAVGAVVAMARTLVEQATRPVLGVGIGTPGVVDGDGVVVLAPNLGWEREPLAQRVGEALDLPVHVANDANAAALAEHTFGGASGSGLILIAVGKGVGSGLLLDGALLRGHHHAAGELGHVVVDERGDGCACGRRGCLETVLAAPALRAAIDGLDDAGRRAALAKVGRRLGSALAPVVSVLDLREIRLSGPADLLDGALLEGTASVLRRRTMAVVGEDLDLRMASLGADVVLAGAAVLVLSGQARRLLTSHRVPPVRPVPPDPPQRTTTPGGTP